MAKIPDENSEPMPVTPDDLNRRSPLDYVNASGDRIRQLFSTRQKVIDGLKTTAWVVSLTILIWIYAEREQLVSTTVQSVPVTIGSTDLSRFIEPSGAVVSLKLSGPQEAVRRVADMLTARIPRGLSIDIGSSLGIGQNRPVNVLASIQNQDAFRNNGVTVESAQPPELFVNIYDVDTRTLPVEVPPDVTNLAPGSHFDPPTVTLRGPKEVIQNMEKFGLLHVYANLAGYSQLFKTPGSQTLPTVPLMWPVLADKTMTEKLHMDKEHVSAAVAVVASDEPFVLETLLITVSCPPALIGDSTAAVRYDLVLNGGAGDSIRDVTVIGSHQAIADLQAKRTHVKASIEILPQDVGKDEPRTLIYVLPDGLKVSPADLERKVQFHLTLRN